MEGDSARISGKTLHNTTVCNQQFFGRSQCEMLYLGSQVSHCGAKLACQVSHSASDSASVLLWKVPAGHCVGSTEACGQKAAAGQGRQSVP